MIDTTQKIENEDWAVGKEDTMDQTGFYTTWSVALEAWTEIGEASCFGLRNVRALDRL